MEKDPREVARHIARENWVEAGKHRQVFLSKIKELQDSHGGTNYTDRLMGLEATMAQLRLACVQVVFHNFEYALEKNVESTLWQAHTHFNTQYRTILSRLGGERNQVVQKRKVDKLYRDFLKTSQFFYRTYIQRLAGRFDVPELRRAAGALDLEVPDTSESTANSSPLHVKVVRACYMTLVRLGDLARYRCQASERASKANFDTALTYYSLANTLDPDDGSSHHQMGVLYQLQSQQLDVMYHFHRSISIERPYRLGPDNLERGFKSARNQPATRRGVTQDPSEMMATWFLRLHAFYYQGEAFSAQAELEKEVLHRLDMSIKGEGNEILLLKMILISIAAYDIALGRVKATWSQQRSQSCQFLLHFNVQMALVVTRLLKTALQGRPPKDFRNDVDDDLECISDFPASLEKILPLFRIYFAWVYVSRADFLQYRDFLEPNISELYGLVADTLTLLLPYVTSHQDAAEAQYLLPEDAEAIGLKPLMNQTLPLFSMMATSEDGTIEDRKISKPHKESCRRHFKPQTETLWRIRDIVCCGVYLAGSNTFPVTMVQTEGGSCAWVYVDQSSQQSTLDETMVAQFLAVLRLGLHKVPTTGKVDASAPSVRPTDVMAAPMKYPLAFDAALSRVSSETHLTNQNLGPSQKSRKSPSSQELSEDAKMVDMVNKLVEDEDDVLDAQIQANRPAEETNYGMDSSIANDIFGPLAAAPSARSISTSKKPIPKIPWYAHMRHPTSGDYIVSGTPDDIASASHSELPAYAAPRAMYGSSGLHQRTPSAGNDVSALGDLRISPASPYASMSTLYGSVGSGDPAYPGAHRGSALDNLRSALNAQYGSIGIAHSPSPGYTPGSAGPGQPNPLYSPAATGSPIQHADQEQPRTDELGYRQEKSPQRYSSNSQAQPGGQNATKQGERFQRARNATNAIVSPAGSLGQPYGYQRTTPLGSPFTPSIHSPASNASDRQLSTASQGQTGTSSSMAFSHPSSIWAGTPANLLGTMACNGNIYNASTPFGRIGGANNRDDPTHFRNRMQKMLGDAEDTSDYDKQVLQAALADNTNQGRQKES